MTSRGDKKIVILLSKKEKYIRVKEKETKIYSNDSNVEVDI
jgi:hypothetical protein